MAVRPCGQRPAASARLSAPAPPPSTGERCGRLRGLAVPADVEHAGQIAGVLEAADRPEHEVEQDQALRPGERLVRDAAGLDRAVALEDLAVFMAEAAFEDAGTGHTEVLVHAGNRAGLDLQQDRAGNF